ncbi:hypothetical protein EVAR_17710_1 [Eumeta japonica]|uniref:Uncharacterized protein n=1 Tax=Eumeta variegata TaxID=151549 RepID=A0A4C1UT52_EUMVA|nr:hypothetical protein EVAR_17710_1 [Eumeta japonica]
MACRQSGVDTWPMEESPFQPASEIKCIFFERAFTSRSRATSLACRVKRAYEEIQRYQRKCTLRAGTAPAGRAQPKQTGPELELDAVRLNLKIRNIDEHEPSPMHTKTARPQRPPNAVHVLRIKVPPSSAANAAWSPRRAQKGRRVRRRRPLMRARRRHKRKHTFYKRARALRRRGLLK